MAGITTVAAVVDAGEGSFCHYGDISKTLSPMAIASNRIESDRIARNCIESHEIASNRIESHKNGIKDVTRTLLEIYHKG